MKKGFTWDELCGRWNINKYDLADIVFAGKLRGVFNDDFSVLHLVDDGSFVEYSHDRMSSLRQESLTVDEITKLIFHISDIEEYENKNGIKPKSKDGRKQTNTKMTDLERDRNIAKKIAQEYIKDCDNRRDIPYIYKAVELIKDKLSREYRDKKTIHNWIKELFPKESREQGMGRPKKE